SFRPSNLRQACSSFTIFATEPPNVPSWKHSSFYPIKAIDAIFEGFDFVMSAWSILYIDIREPEGTGCLQCPKPLKGTSPTMRRLARNE
ncbi:hypothetical protein ACFFIQ_12340, partial [Sphingobium indicum]|uniref:hypothetical protein n=1 Tax=Sphingobium indicum TaxID=332055 RepID=UPI0035E9D23A